MFLALYLVVSIVPAIYTCWRFAGKYAWDNAESNSKHRNNRYSNNISWKPSIDIWFGGYFFGFFAGLIWPVIAVLYLLSKIHNLSEINYTPKDQRLRMQRERIEILEREAGIR